MHAAQAAGLPRFPPLHSRRQANEAVQFGDHKSLRRQKRKKLHERQPQIILREHREPFQIANRIIANETDQPALARQRLPLIRHGETPKPLPEPFERRAIQHRFNPALLDDEPPLVSADHSDRVKADNAVPYPLGRSQATHDEAGYRPAVRTGGTNPVRDNR